MNKRLGLRSCRVLFESHNQWLLGISCLVVSVCSWQSGGQCPVVLTEVLAELDHSCGDGRAHSGWHSRAPPVAPHWGNTETLAQVTRGRVGSKQTLHPPAGNP